MSDQRAKENLRRANQMRWRVFGASKIMQAMKIWTQMKKLVASMMMANENKKKKGCAWAMNAKEKRSEQEESKLIWYIRRGIKEVDNIAGKVI